MSDTVLEIWHSHATKGMHVPIIPDGCRDLIFRYPKGERPNYFISDLDDMTNEVQMETGDRYCGFRLLPGTRIDEEKLLASLSEKEFLQEEICDRIQAFTHRSQSVAEALECLAFEANNSPHAAALLGVSPRSLQRLLKQETGRPPVFWLQLARVKKAARALETVGSFAELSISMGYADQAHMSRDFRHWLGITPAKLKTSSLHKQQLENAGYASPIGVQISTRKPFASLT